MKIRCFRLLMVHLILVATLSPAHAITESRRGEFREILEMDVRDLTARTEEVLRAKYPEEDWSGYGFPMYVYAGKPVEMGYKIAVKEPQLLAVPTCACFCDAMGHETLAHCFLRGGTLGKGFDAHGASCNICYTQAMRAFLWSAMGATNEDILAGMRQLYPEL